MVYETITDSVARGFSVPVNPFDLCSISMSWLEQEDLVQLIATAGSDGG